ncbi:MAG: DUF4159 domain-containing protein [Terriglobia bacterium]
MRHKSVVLVALLGLAAGSLVIAQNPFKEYPGFEYNNFPLPSDWSRKAEWTRARLRYPDIYGYPFSTPPDFAGYWTMDYPRSDRHLLEGVKRLTRIDTKSVEQVVSLDGTNDIFNWPIVYGVETGHWLLPDDQAKQLGEYLLRGGFLMVDDFHGDREWEVFTNSMHRVLPGRPIVDLPDSDQIFHTIYDLSDRFQVPGAQYFETGREYESGDVRLGSTLAAGKIPHWRGIYDDKGRVIVAICHNMDLGDAWEHSDEPEYKEKWASLAYRVAMDYFIYDLTH